MIALFLALAAQAQECKAVAEVPETLQVAWVSRIGARAGARTPLPVVRVADLRRLVEDEKRDPTQVLRALGLIGKRAQARGVWKVTVFDVERESLCRPIFGPEGVDVGGVATCPATLQRPGKGVKGRAYSGCGYLLDTETGARTLDTWKIEWRDAVSAGFCVLPLTRFLTGA